MNGREFDDLVVSTRTMIATGNMEFNMEAIFETMPMMEMRVKDSITKIIKIYYKDRMRQWGESTSSREQESEGGNKSFRNALNVIMMIGEKRVNFKVSKNGKFQLTGCKEEEHARRAVFSFLEILMQHCPGEIVWRANGAGKVIVYLETVMTNVDCGVGYCINRQALDRIVNTTTSYHSLLETSFGYTGVNIKFPMRKNRYDLLVDVMEWEGGCPETLEERRRPLRELVMEPVDKESKPKYNTFLVFHSGRFIMSGMHEETMREDYDLFMSILKKHQGEIREVLDIR